jgi:hypothetical protein
MEIDMMADFMGQQDGTFFGGRIGIHAVRECFIIFDVPVTTPVHKSKSILEAAGLADNEIHGYTGQLADFISFGTHETIVDYSTRSVRRFFGFFERKKGIIYTEALSLGDNFSARQGPTQQGQRNNIRQMIFVHRFTGGRLSN